VVKTFLNKVLWFKRGNSEEYWYTCAHLYTIRQHDLGTGLSKQPLERVEALREAYNEPAEEYDEKKRRWHELDMSEKILIFFLLISVVVMIFVFTNIFLRRGLGIDLFAARRSDL